MTPKEKVEAFKRTFGTEEGQKVLNELAIFCHQNKPLAVAGDPYATFWNDGKRCVYLEIKHWIDLVLPEEGSELSAEKQGANRPTRRKKNARE